MDTITVRIERSGRLLIPAVIRRKLNLKEGSEVLLRLDETGIQLSTREQALQRIRERLRRYIPEDRILSDELILERRAEADRENQP